MRSNRASCTGYAETHMALNDWMQAQRGICECIHIAFDGMHVRLHGPACEASLQDTRSHGLFIRTRDDV